MYFVFLCFYKNEINITKKKKKTTHNTKKNMILSWDKSLFI